MSMLVACDDSSSRGAQEPPPFVPPSAQMESAKQARFKPLVDAIMARHAADAELGDFRGSIGEDMNDEQRAKFNELFGKVGASGQVIGKIVNAGNWSDDDRVVMDMIMSLPYDQLKALAGK